MKLFCLQSNLIVGFIYRDIDRWMYSTLYLTKTADKLSKKVNKAIVLLSDLLKFDTSDHVNSFLEDLTSNSLQPKIDQTAPNQPQFVKAVKHSWSKLQFLVTLYPVYQIIFHNFLNYQISFQILLQINITYLRIGKTSTTDYF